MVVGNGNVAADVARMLALTPNGAGDDRRGGSRARRPLGGRGAGRSWSSAGAAPPRPPSRTPSCSSSARCPTRTYSSMPATPSSTRSAARSSRARTGITARRNVEILGGYAGREPEGKRRRIVLRFLVSPVEILGADRVEGIPYPPQRADRRRRRCDPPPTNGGDRDDRLRPRLPLDRLPRRSARGPAVRRAPRGGPERPRSCPRRGGPVRGEYVVGWIKRGPPASSARTSATPRRPWTPRPRRPRCRAAARAGDPDRESLEDWLLERKPDMVAYAGWAAIDRAEKAAGEPQGRPRVKLCSFDELLEAARERVPS